MYLKKTFGILFVIIENICKILDIVKFCGIS